MTWKTIQVTELEDEKAGRAAPLETPTVLTAYSSKGSSGAITIRPDPSSQQAQAPRMKSAVVEDQYAGRSPRPNLREEITKWFIVAALLVLAVSVTMEPFILL